MTRPDITPISDDAIPGIEERALAATQGAWLATDLRFGAATVVTADDEEQPVAEECSREDAAHVAGMSPPTTLALIARVRLEAEARAAAEARVAELERALKPFGLMAEARPVDWYKDEECLSCVMTARDLRAAARALHTTEGGDGK